MAPAERDPDRNSSLMRILLMSHFYPPEVGAPQRRWDAFVGRWTLAGHTVTVLTAAPHYPGGRNTSGAHRPLRAERGRHGELVLRLPYLPGSTSARRKLADQSLVAACSLVASAGQRSDVVVATVPGLPTLFAGQMYSVLRSTPLVVEMRDAWPDLITDSDLATGRTARHLSRLVTAAQRRADGVVTVSTDFADILRSRGAAGGNVETISNGIDVDSVPAMPPPTVGSRLRLLYLGTHGISQGLHTAITAAARLGPGLVEMTFIGEGAEKEALQRHAGRSAAPVRFLPTVAGPDLWRAYQDADSCLVSLRDWPAFRYTVPSKLYEVFATGRHVTACVSGEAARLVKEAEAGDSLAPDDPDALAAFWRRLAVHRGELQRPRTSRTWVRAHASYDILAARYLTLLESVCAGRRR